MAIRMQDQVLPSGEVVKFFQENWGPKLPIETNGKNGRYFQNWTDFLLLVKESIFTIFDPKIPFWVVRGAPNPNFAF